MNYSDESNKNKVIKEIVRDLFDEEEIPIGQGFNVSQGYGVCIAVDGSQYADNIAKTLNNFSEHNKENGYPYSSLALYDSFDNSLHVALDKNLCRLLEDEDIPQLISVINNRWLKNLEAKDIIRRPVRTYENTKENEIVIKYADFRSPSEVRQFTQTLQEVIEKAIVIPKELENDHKPFQNNLFNNEVEVQNQYITMIVNNDKSLVDFNKLQILEYYTSDVLNSKGKIPSPCLMLYSQEEQSLIIGINKEWLGSINQTPSDIIEPIIYPLQTNLNTNILPLNSNIELVKINNVSMENYKQIGKTLENTIIKENDKYLEKEELSKRLIFSAEITVPKTYISFVEHNKHIEYESQHIAKAIKYPEKMCDLSPEEIVSNYYGCELEFEYQDDYYSRIPFIPSAFVLYDYEKRDISIYFDRFGPYADDEEHLFHHEMHADGSRKAVIDVLSKSIDLKKHDMEINKAIVIHNASIFDYDNVSKQLEQEISRIEIYRENYFRSHSSAFLQFYQPDIKNDNFTSITINKEMFYDEINGAVTGFSNNNNNINSAVLLIQEKDTEKFYIGINNDWCKQMNIYPDEIMKPIIEKLSAPNFEISKDYWGSVFVLQKEESSKNTPVNSEEKHDKESITSKEIYNQLSELINDKINEVILERDLITLKNNTYINMDCSSMLMLTKDSQCEIDESTISRCINNFSKYKTIEKPPCITIYDEYTKSMYIAIDNEWQQSRNIDTVTITESIFHDKTAFNYSEEFGIIKISGISQETFENLGEQIQEKIIEKNIEFKKEENKELQKEK